MSRRIFAVPPSFLDVGCSFSYSGEFITSVGVRDLGYSRPRRIENADVRSKELPPVIQLSMRSLTSLVSLFASFVQESSVVVILGISL